jgi:hypothetical protein
VVKKADRAFIAEPAPKPPANQPGAGLLNIDGIVDGGLVFRSLDALVDLQAQLQANGGTPTHIVLDPLGWAALRKFRTDDASNQSLIGAGTIALRQQRNDGYDVLGERIVLAHL